MRIMDNLGKRLLLLTIDAYKVVLSPLFWGSCRFNPSCSTYMREAICIHGPLKGVSIGLRRLLRCNSFFPGGYDPVPQKNRRG
ncbi:membrane protein insertion efficiency factor YidD [bacterium (candidate division B38) B3_B38]|nr:MAG: membrane protein insertion efficiency factor YidD [bacterium (candidate division B38) B3_B38]